MPPLRHRLPIYATHILQPHVAVRADHALGNSGPTTEHLPLYLLVEMFWPAATDHQPNRLGVLERLPHELLPSGALSF